MSKPLNKQAELRRTKTLGSEKAVSICQNLQPSVCRYCQFYQSHGRSGGYCQQLGVSVRSSWCSCSLALAAFAPSWEKH